MYHWYPLLKTIHITAVTLSLSLFVLRGGWMLADSAWLQRRMVRIVPHVVDTVLLVSALGLISILHQYPFVDSWLTAKVCGLIVYIGLGTIALKRGRTKPARLLAGLAAILVFGYIVSVALTHNAYGLLLALRR